MDGSPPGREVRRTTGIAIAILTASVFALYAPVGRHPFVVTDDPDYVTANPHVLSGLTAAGLRWALTSFDAANWHPLTWLSHMLDVQLFGLHAGAHHLMNVLIHLTNTLLLFGALRRMTGGVGASTLVALLFAVHPLHVESVAWVAERKDVLSMSFWMAAILLYSRYARKPAPRRLAAVALCTAFGLLAKPMLVTVPLTLLLLDFWPLGRFRAASPAQLLLEKLPLFALSAASALVTVLAQRAGDAFSPSEAFPFWSRIANALVATVVYVRKTLWPADLAVFYPHPGDSLQPGKTWAALLLIAAATVTAILTRRRRPWLLTGWFWYAATLAPVAGLVQVGSQSMADRYTYMPLLGLLIILAFELGRLAAGGKRVHAVALPGFLAVAVLSLLARAQLAHWVSSISLFEHAVSVTPPNWSAQFGLGVAYERAGRRAEAISHYREALGLNPHYAPGHYNLGSLLGAEGNLAAAIAELREATRLDPGFLPAQANLGYALQLAGRLDEAIAVLRGAVAREPTSADLHTKLGQTLQRRGDQEEAWLHFREAMALGSRAP